MDLEFLEKRLLELQTSAESIANNYHIVCGHKAEVEFQIKFERERLEAAALVTQDVLPIE